MSKNEKKGNPVYKKLQKLIRWWKSLHQTDRFLLIFMIILQLQSAYNLISRGVDASLDVEDAAMLDVVIRTTTAGIFGYFISAGFRGEPDNLKSEARFNAESSSNSEEHNTPTETAVFTEDIEVDSMKTYTYNRSRRIHQQTVIVAFIGISSLLLLIVARNHLTLSTASISSLSQMRDFVSGSVGFLIGHSVNENGS